MITRSGLRGCGGKAPVMHEGRGLSEAEVFAVLRPQSRAQQIVCPDDRNVPDSRGCPAC